MDEKELKEFVIQERLSEYFKQNAQDNDKEIEMRNAWAEKLKEISPSLADDFEKYMDWLAIKNGDEFESIYLFGVQDGAKLAISLLGIEGTRTEHG